MQCNYVATSNRGAYVKYLHLLIHRTYLYSMKNDQYEPLVCKKLCTVHSQRNSPNDYPNSLIVFELDSHSQYEAEKPKIGAIKS